MGGHGFDLGLSQSGWTDNIRTDKGQTVTSVGFQDPIWGSPIQDLGIWDPDSPNRKSACTPNKPQTLVSHKQTVTGSIWG